MTDNSMPVIGTTPCWGCGKKIEIKKLSEGPRYCKECKRLRYNQRKRERYKAERIEAEMEKEPPPLPKPKIASLSETAAQAKKCGMSYGQYVEYLSKRMR